MYGEYSLSPSSKKDQQVPTLQGLDSTTDPTPLLEEILTHEQNTCIQIRDTCTLMAQSVRDVLGSACPQGGYVQVMQDKLGQLEQAVNSLECTIKRKSVFSNEFLDSASQRWFEKRLSCKSRKRRLRNFKRKDSPANRGVSHQDSPPGTPTAYSFLPYEDPRLQIPASAPHSPHTHLVPSPHPHSPTHQYMQQIPTPLTIPPSTPVVISPLPSPSPSSSTSPNTSPRATTPRGRSNSTRSPAACVPSTPSFFPRHNSEPYYFIDEKGKSMSISNIIN